MKSLTKNKALYLLIGIILVTKFFWIDRIPVGLAHDEAIYAVNALSYKERGFDLSGYGLPLSLFRSETEGGITPVAPLLYSAFSYVFPLTQTSLRVLMVFVNILTAYVFFKIVNVLTNDKSIATISLVLFLINPWSTFLSRWAVDTPWALLFYLLGMYGLLTSKRALGFLVTILSFFLGFFSYHGAKLVYLPLLVIISWYRYSNTESSKIKRSISIVSLIGISIFVIYVIIDLMLPGGSFSGRSRDIVLTRTSYFEEIVNEGRKNSLESDFSQYFINKPVIMSQVLLEKYLTAFDPHTLFVSGDTRATYRFEYHGLFYLVEIVFIVVGFLYLYSKKNKLFTYLSALIVFSPLATGLGATDTSVINRSFMLLPLIIIFSASGITVTIQLLKRVNPLLIITVLLLFAISYMNFLYFYFYRYPITHQENYFLSDKLLVYYAQFSKDVQTVTVVNTTPGASFLEGIIYNDSSKSLFNKLRDQKLTDESYLIDHKITYTSSCPKDYNDNETYIISRESNCVVPEHDAEIINQKDAGELYKIVNDKVCNNSKLEVYRRFHSITDYRIYDLSKEDFCRIWINSPKL